MCFIVGRLNFRLTAAIGMLIILRGILFKKESAFAIVSVQYVTLVQYMNVISMLYIHAEYSFY